MGWLRQMFEDNGGFVSSKRGLGALTLVFSMIFGVIVFVNQFNCLFKPFNVPV